MVAWPHPFFPAIRGMSIPSFRQKPTTERSHIPLPTTQPPPKPPCPHQDPHGGGRPCWHHGTGQGPAPQAGDTRLSRQSFIYTAAARKQLFAKPERNSTQWVPLNPGDGGDRREWRMGVERQVLRTRQPQTSSSCPPCQTSLRCSSSSHQHHGGPSPGGGMGVWVQAVPQGARTHLGGTLHPSTHGKPHVSYKNPVSFMSYIFLGCTLLFQYHGCQRRQYGGGKTLWRKAHPQPCLSHREA